MSNQLYLISGSIRRHELLNQIGVKHYVVPVDVDESQYFEENVKDYINRVTQKKLDAGLNTLKKKNIENVVALAADTIVVVDNQILRKPRNKKESYTMLMLLSSSWHKVLTQIVMSDGDETYKVLCESDVEFNHVSKIAAEKYWLTSEPKGKAGGYAIQGYGSVFVKCIKGSYSSIVGLPIAETAILLSKFSIPIWGSV